MSTPLLFALAPILSAPPGAAEVFQLDHGLTLDLTGLAEIEHTPGGSGAQLVGTFEEYFQVPGMLYRGKQEVTGGSESTDNYTQAASIIEFSRSTEWA